MELPIDVGNALPTGIQEYDGFDVTTIDVNRWKTPVKTGDMNLAQSGGYLVISNAAGAAGTACLETVRKFGKNWRISSDLLIDDLVGATGAISLVLYKNASCYVRIGPYKTALVDCNCYLQVKRSTEVEQARALTSDVVDTTNIRSYTLIVLNQTIIVYYNGICVTSFPMEEMFNYNIRIEGSTSVDGTTLNAKANDFEIFNGPDTLLMATCGLSKQNNTYLMTIDGLSKQNNTYLMTIDGLSKQNSTYLQSIIATLAGGIANNPRITDFAGNISLSSTTETFLELTKTVYGKKFKVCLFADLEGANLPGCYISDAGGARVDQAENANNLVSNNIRLCTAAGAQVNDAAYFGSHVQFKKLDIYMEGGTSNTDNVYKWEYWNGTAWATLTVTDGTLYNGKVFGKSGRITWTTVLGSPTGMTGYWVRARITKAGSSLPKATHVQVSEDGKTGFDSRAAFLSNLIVNIYRKRASGSYARLPVDTAMPFTQCILTRNVDISNLTAWQDIRIGFKLSATPTATITIPYTGYIETIEEN